MRALVLSLSCLLLAPAGALGATYYVDDSDLTSDGAGPSYTCGSLANKCGTIQRGIDHAASGDIIVVAAGTYTSESVAVNKAVTLRGPQAGNDARVRSVVVANEAAVTGPGGQSAFQVSSSGATIDGFLVQNNTSATQGAGIFMTAIGGVRIENSVIRNNIAGIRGLPDHTVITHNLFQTNNNAGSISGTGIYTDQSDAGGPLNDVQITDNNFSGNSRVGVLLGSTSATLGQDDIEVRGNHFSGDGNAMQFLNTTNLLVADNVVEGTLASSVVIGGGVSQAVFSGNTLLNGATRGFRLGDFGGGGTNPLVSIVGNTIRGFPTAGIELDTSSTALPTIQANRITGNAAGGLVTPIANTAAANNWWGCNGGPGTAGCDSVTGSAAGTATTAPWTVLSLRAAPATIPAAGGTATITADLSKASDGTSTGIGVPNGTSIAMTTTKGTVTSPALTTSGLANGTLTADAGFGTTTVTATLDNASATTDVTVRPPDSDGDGITDDKDCAPADTTRPAAGNIADVNCDGVADPPPVPPADTTAPAITATTISKGRLRFTSSERALVRIVVRRKKGKRFVRAAATAIIARQGQNTVRLPGKPKHNRARVALSATDAAGNRAKALTLKV